VSHSTSTSSRTRGCQLPRAPGGGSWRRNSQALGDEPPPISLLYEGVLVMGRERTLFLPLLSPLGFRCIRTEGMALFTHLRGRVQPVENSFVPSPAPGPGAEYAVFVVFRTCFRALLGRRPGRHLLFQQAEPFRKVQKARRAAHIARIGGEGAGRVRGLLVRPPLTRRRVSGPS
jgi:hypothetical protein